MFLVRDTKAYGQHTLSHSASQAILLLHQTYRTEPPFRRPANLDAFATFPPVFPLTFAQTLKLLVYFISSRPADSVSDAQFLLSEDRPVLKAKKTNSIVDTHAFGAFHSKLFCPRWTKQPISSPFEALISCGALASTAILFRGDKFAKFPVMVGDVDDEGTLFAFSTLSITFVDLAWSWCLARRRWSSLTTFEPCQTRNAEKRFILTPYIHYYPVSCTRKIPQEYVYNLVAHHRKSVEQQMQGALGVLRSAQAERTNPEFKRIAAFIGDQAMASLRRLFLHYASRSQPAWSCEQTGKSTPNLGAFHGTDLPLFFPLNATTAAMKDTGVDYLSECPANALFIHPFGNN
ncbi:hypothetical protein C8R47DRAFT_1199522 [Mycena vitilis]|nr:hypothetical protein C8R47DRAFT_1199522 [Mycena vitilis]